MTHNKKIFILTAIIIVLLSMSAVTVYGHSGRTDSKGGHTNHATGDYHYHHGYSAHDHPNGVCPYESNSSEDNDGNNAPVIILIVSICAAGILTLAKHLTSSGSKAEKVIYIIRNVALVIAIIFLVIVAMGDGC